jgi:hypothetical protein
MIEMRSNSNQHLFVPLFSLDVSTIIKLFYIKKLIKLFFAVVEIKRGERGMLEKFD